MEQPTFTPYNSEMSPPAQNDLPNATAVLVLGILSIVFVGLIGAILAIISLSMWGNVKSLYEADPSQYTAASYSRAKAGRVCAIVGLSLLGLAILIVLLLAIIFS